MTGTHARTHPYEALLRHFADLRDGTHGTATDRAGKERLFATAVELLDPAARQVLDEANRFLLLGSGLVEATGVRNDADGLSAQWTLSWPEQRATGLPALGLIAHYGRGFHHPHLRGVTVRDWPMNVFSAADASDQVPILRAIVVADLHNLVFQRDYRIVPATTRG
ncbi:hypothetical protein EV385_5708 [Krasilnikovia cinnamomea]|uniref:Uncharacterized protein n=1 Tax=Krasilnikovia cinnamomea TaxID=349313 RepID=A0A4Q7ZSE5_9ACTN|nr:hypothetical protein [Krasilnikovia cinnamomea]RZU53774.1 hypothetical protein EV385_5708 [Krasilnikovia cinnamomea]